MDFTKKYSWIIALVTFLIVSAVFQLLSPNIYDPDSFYHIRHAWLYKTSGFFNSSFPWVQYSVINKYQADIWYGFHILLTPLTFFNDLVFGIKLGAFLITTAVLFSFYIVF